MNEISSPSFLFFQLTASYQLFPFAYCTVWALNKGAGNTILKILKEPTGADVLSSSASRVMFDSVTSTTDVGKSFAAPEHEEASSQAEVKATSLKLPMRSIYCTISSQIKREYRNISERYVAALYLLRQGSKVCLMPSHRLNSLPKLLMRYIFLLVVHSLRMT